MPYPIVTQGSPPGPHLFAPSNRSSIPIELQVIVPISKHRARHLDELYARVSGQNEKLEIHLPNCCRSVIRVN